MSWRDWSSIAVGLAVVFILMGGYSEAEPPLVPAPPVSLCLEMPPPCTDDPPARWAWDIDHWENLNQ